MHSVDLPPSPYPLNPLNTPPPFRAPSLPPSGSRAASLARVCRPCPALAPPLPSLRTAGFHSLSHWPGFRGDLNLSVSLPWLRPSLLARTLPSLPFLSLYPSHSIPILLPRNHDLTLLTYEGKSPATHPAVGSTAPVGDRFPTSSDPDDASTLTLSRLRDLNNYILGAGGRRLRLVRVQLDVAGASGVYTAIDAPGAAPSSAKNLYRVANWNPNSSSNRV
ncbi:hypothetical protein DFH09DRAFT_1306958 [Mycena vulgaris]|nr:hypothetical protein DFH09DRAFT_1306958 [Mycena vulgaris]